MFESCTSVSGKSTIDECESPTMRSDGDQVERQHFAGVGWLPVRGKQPDDIGNDG